MYKFFGEYHYKLPKNIWIGVSIESEQYMQRALILQQVCATVRFISFEPLLGFIKIIPFLLAGIQWAIIGGESGPKNREMKKEWAMQLLEDLKKEGIPVFFKQWGGNKRCQCHGAWGCRLVVDKTYDEFPKMVVA
jgi:protein gp37